MKDYTFWIPITATGESAQDAWEAAMEAFTMHPPAHPPVSTFGEHDEVPAAEILGGSLEAGFTLEHGDG